MAAARIATLFQNVPDPKIRGGILLSGADMDDYITKPVRLNELEAALKRASDHQPEVVMAK
jgi:hypothetical protein